MLTRVCREDVENLEGTMTPTSIASPASTLRGEICANSEKAVMVPLQSKDCLKDGSLEQALILHTSVLPNWLAWMISSSNELQVNDLAGCLPLQLRSRTAFDVGGRARLWVTQSHEQTPSDFILIATGRVRVGKTHLIPNWATLLIVGPTFGFLIRTEFAWAWRSCGLTSATLLASPSGDRFLR